MKIESEVTKLSRYGDDGLEGFYTAVDNGQARLAMTILVDVIAAFADKIDELEAAILPKEEEVKPPVVEVKHPPVSKTVEAQDGMEFLTSFLDEIDSKS